METRRRLLGAEYPEMLDILHNLALTMKWQGRDEMVIALIEEIRCVGRSVGPNHPFTASSREAWIE